MHHNGIESIDHPVIAVADLEESRQTWERLGFTVPPRGSHIEWGTGNLCIMFPDDYLEMRGILDPERFTMHLDAHLEKFGEGLMGVAFRTNDVQQSYTDMLANGVDAAEPRRLTRNFEHPEGWTKPSFELSVPEASGIEGLMHVVVIQHLTPELIRRPDFLEHANSTIGVNSMSGIVFDLNRVAEKMRRLLGDDVVQVTRHKVRITVATGQILELMSRETFENRFGPLSTPDRKPRLGAMQLRVASVTATGETLTGNDVPFDKDGDVITVQPQHTNGVLLEFTENPPA